MTVQIIDVDSDADIPEGCFGYFLTGDMTFEGAMLDHKYLTGANPVKVYRKRNRRNQVILYIEKDGGTNEQ